MFKRLATMILALILSVAVFPSGAMADVAEVNPNSYKTNITTVSVGAPVTGLDGKKYTPVDVHFTAENDPDESGVSMLEGVIKALHDGVENHVAGVGMTLMRVTGEPGNNQFNWDPGTKQGVAKFNVPVLDDEEAQTVEQSQATGQEEVNGVKENNAVKISMESWVYGAPDCPVIPSNEAVYVYKRSELPRVYAYSAYSITEFWEWRFNAAQHWELCTEGDSAGQTRNQGPHTFDNSSEAADFSVSLPEGFDASQPLGPDNSPTLTGSDGTECVFDGYGFKSLNAGGSADSAEPAPAPVYLSSFANLTATATVKAKICDTCCYTALVGGASGQVDGASVNIDKMTAPAGEEITLSVLPEEGREIENVSAQSNGQDVELRETKTMRRLKGDEATEINYYYTQPEGSVTITVTMKAPCQHANAVPAFNWEGHWLYCPDCGRGVAGTFEEHFTDWRNSRYEDIQTVRVTVPGMEPTEEIPASVAMGVGNTVSFLGSDKTFTYLPDNSGKISCMDDETDSLYIPGGFAASPGDPAPEVPDRFSVMIPGAEIMMMVEYENCGYGVLDIFGAHSNKSKIWGENWFAAAGEAVTFGVNANAGYRCNVVVKSGDTVIPYEPGQGYGEYVFTMPAGNVTLTVSAEPLPRLTLPANTKAIEESAFEGCGAFVIAVPDGCESIGAYAFRNCPNLEALFIPASVTSIDETALDGCNQVCIYGEEDSVAREYAYRQNNTYFWSIAELDE